VALGVAAGLLLAEVANRMTGGEIMAGRGAVLLPSVAVLMSVVGVLAAWGPARRALAIQPTDALRAE
jgi:ABC-type antimicrobial peptide transport system permease subunit